MRKIGIDARLLGQTGVGRYITNLLLNLQYSSDITYYVYVYDKRKNKIAINIKNVIIQEAPYHWHTIAEQTLFLGKLNADALNLMHFTYFSYPFFYRRPFIITLHDLIPYFYHTGRATTGYQFIYRFKHFFYKVLVKNAVNNACALITPSETVKKEIIFLFGEKYNSKIHTIYEGVDQKLTTVIENKLLRGKPTRYPLSWNNTLEKKFSFPFYIYVGNFYPHKNVERLIKAFAQIQGAIKLILIGPSDFFSARILQLINKLKCGKKIILFQNPRDEDLVFFYKNAQALIHPSFAEGFGLPLIEAAYFNCSIIASDIPVFNEILDGQFTKFNPYDINDIKTKIEQELKHPKRSNYREIMKRFSFKKMSETTFRLYNKILS